jgi:two-component sensor histidine kinase
MQNQKLLSERDGLKDELSERKRMETALKQSLDDKEMLIKEIHHRVKNNLQIISSILHMKESSTSNQEVAEALRANRNRIYSMSLVHEKLYESESISRVNLKDYIGSLVRRIHQTYDTGAIAIDVDVEPMILTVDHLIPCGLILNELITNSVKHASVDKGTIHVRVALTGGESVELSVRDKGPGLAEKPDFDNAQSLGFMLLSSLSEQLGGTLDYRNENGALFVLRFKKGQAPGG